MTKGDIVLQLALKAMEKQPTLALTVNTKRDEETLRTLAKSNGKIFAELYNTIFDSIKE